ncbi:MAG: transcriptional activator domain-containing protein, partial [Anaerolineae bacterium]|nr:transcriptional activator domain-containing protein [Anaerolineae bacterium]
MSTHSASGKSSEGLRVYMLGPPRVTWKGGPLPIPRRQARALLYYLAAYRRPLPRERISFLFWSDIPETAARTNLSRLLNHLRRALPASDLILTQEGQIYLNPDIAWSDTVTWAQSLGSFSADAARRLILLYRGPFLQGFSLPKRPEFEHWLAHERQHWKRLYLEMLATLLKTEARQGAYEAAITYARRYLEVDKLAEDIHRQLIELYVAVGNRSAALRQFERCVAVLERELGVS